MVRQELLGCARKFVGTDFDLEKDVGREVAKRLQFMEGETVSLTESELVLDYKFNPEEDAESEVTAEDRVRTSEVALAGASIAQRETAAAPLFLDEQAGQRSRGKLHEALIRGQRASPEQDSRGGTGARGGASHAFPSLLTRALVYSCTRERHEACCGPR